MAANGPDQCSPGAARGVRLTWLSAPGQRRFPVALALLPLLIGSHTAIRNSGQNRPPAGVGRHLAPVWTPAGVARAHSSTSPRAGDGSAAVLPGQAGTGMVQSEAIEREVLVAAAPGAQIGEPVGAPAEASREVQDQSTRDQSTRDKSASDKAPADKATGDKGAAGSAGAEGDDKPRKVLLRGEVVLLPEALRQRGIKAYSEEIAQQAVLRTAAGELIPLVPDWRGRAFGQDERLRGRPVELVVNRRVGVPWVSVLSIYARDESGKRSVVDYWCDVCAIPMYEIKDCECCQGPIRLRFRPQSLPRDVPATDGKPTP